MNKKLFKFNLSDGDNRYSVYVPKQNSDYFDCKKLTNHTYFKFSRKSEYNVVWLFPDLMTLFYDFVLSLLKNCFHAIDV